MTDEICASAFEVNIYAINGLEVLATLPVASDGSVDVSSLAIDEYRAEIGTVADRQDVGGDTPLAATHFAILCEAGAEEGPGAEDGAEGADTEGAEEGAEAATPNPAVEAIELTSGDGQATLDTEQLLNQDRLTITFTTHPVLNVVMNIGDLITLEMDEGLGQEVVACAEGGLCFSLNPTVDAVRCRAVFQLDDRGELDAELRTSDGANEQVFSITTL